MIDQNDPRLTAYVLGELSSAEMAEIQAAIHESPELAAAVEEITGMIGLLGEAYGSEEKLSLSDQQKKTIAAKPQKPRSDEGRRWLAVVIAASLAAVLFGGHHILQDYYKGTVRRVRVAQNDSEPTTSFPEVVFRTETRTRVVPLTKMRQESRTRSVPVQRMRTETKQKTLADGTVENYQVQVPYTEHFTQNYTVQVPYTENTTQTYSVEVPYTADGKRIEVEDYAAYGINYEIDFNRRIDETRKGQDVAAFGAGGAVIDGGASIAMGVSGDSSNGIFGGAMGGVDLQGGTGQISGIDLAAAPVVPPASVPPMRGGSITDDMQDGVFGELGLAVDPEGFGEVETDSQGQPMEKLSEELASGEGQPGLLGGGGRVLGPMFRNPDLGKSRLSGELAQSGGQEPMEADFLAGDDGYFAKPKPDLSKEVLKGLVGEDKVDVVGVQQGEQGGESRFDEMNDEDETESLLQRENAELALAEQEDELNLWDSKLAEAQSRMERLSEEFGNRHPEMRGAERAVRQIEEARKKSFEQLQVLEREKVAQAQQLASLESQNGKISRQLEERNKKLAQIRGKVGTGHPDYEAALAQVEVIKRGLEENESTKMRFERVRDSLKQVLLPFKKVDELKKSGSTDERKEALKMLEAKLVEMESAATILEQRLGNGHEAFKAIRTQIEGLKENFKAEKIALQKAIAAKPKSWKRVKAIPNTTRLMVGDKEELTLNGMQVNAQVDGFRARVLVDYFYYNDRERQLEGNFKLRLPDDASLYYFAFGESAYEFSGKGKLAAEEFHRDGRQFVSLAASGVKEARKDQWDNVKEARVVPKEKAAHAFRETVRRRIDPALVEWSGAGVFNAKVFPLSPKKLHRIVVGYDVNLKRTADGQKFELSLPEQTGQCRVEVNVQEIEGVSYSAKPAVDPIPTEVEGKLQKRFVFNNDESPLSSVEVTVNGADNVLLTTTLPLGWSGETADRQDRLGREQLEKASGAEEKDLDDSGEQKSDGGLHPPRSLETRGRPSPREGGARTGIRGDNFWTMQISPDLPVENAAANSRAIFMVDTSLSSSPDKFNVWLKMLQATLENNRDSLKEFDVLFFNIDGHFWKGRYVANTKENVAELKGVLESLALEGATDLYGAVQAVADADWIGEGGGRPDLFLLSDGEATWGETDLRLIDQVLQRPQLGSLFAYQTGLTGTSISGLRFLAGQSGGAVFSIASEDEIQTASKAHRNRPWQLKSIRSKGANDVLSAGRVQWVYPGQTITLVGRGTVEKTVELEMQQGSDLKTVTVEPLSIQSELASRMYGHVAVGQLESLGEKVFDVSAAYARHFRITGQTCSLLMLDSEEDYKRFDIKPQEDLFVVKAKAASKLVRETLEKNSESLADPKARLETWLSRLESMPGMQFKMPTALKLAMDDIQVDAISQSMNCTLVKKESLSNAYSDGLDGERLDYERVAVEARRRMASSVDDAIKVYSSLIENNPGDIIVARDIAFTAMELDRPAAAFHLLRRVAQARPYQGNIYPAIGQCLAELGKADMAIVYYEIAMNGTFQRQGGEFKQIVAAEYIHLLRKVVSGELESSVKDYAAARLETLGKHLPFGTADVVITMMWNQDQQDVDLHVIEPSGEECSYQHKRTKSGGQITTDITTGFGPEMYFNANAPRGKYEVKAKFFGSGQNRVSTRNKVYMTIIRGFGTDEESMERRAIELNKVGEKVSVMTLGVE